MFEKILRPDSSNNLILQTLSELGKQYSRLELISVNLRKREKSLFEICRSSLEKGQKERAVIYANEVAEVRKTSLVVNNTKLVLEKAITRLETIRDVAPAINELSGLFGDVKNSLKILTKVMPVMTPEFDALNKVVAEIITTAQIDSVPSIEPVVIRNDSTEAILQEAAEIVEEDLTRKIPEPPMSTITPSTEKVAKPMIAITTSGVEIYREEVAEDSSVIKKQIPPAPVEASNSLSEELVLDYIYRNLGKVDIAQCSEELGMSQNDIINMLDLLNTKGKIRIER